MSAIKDWLADHIDDIDNDDFLNMGYTREDIEELRESFSED